MCSVALSWALRGPCRVHPRYPVLHFEWVNVPGHVVTNDETSSPLLFWSCSLISNMHLTNYYETGWINLLDVESSPSKYWPIPIYQIGIISVCYVYQKWLSWWFCTRTFDDSAHEFWNVWWYHTRILHTPTTTSSFNWILVSLPDTFYPHKPC